jgi:HSP20 family protein
MLYTPATTAPALGLRRELYRLFEDVVGRGPAGRSEWTPAVDIRETDQELTFAIEVAGSEPSDVEVTTENGILTVQGQRPEDWNEEEGRYHLLERGYGSFVRRFQLPEGVDVDKIQADVDNGLLQVRIPKSALPQPRKIHVNAGTGASNRAKSAVSRGDGRQDSPMPVTKARVAK